MEKKHLLPYSISLKAQKDLDKAVHWYNEKQWSLGSNFVEFMMEKIMRIRKNPEILMFIGPRIQRAKLKKFPYTIFFTKEDNSILILRIRHNKQKALKRFR